MRQVNLAIIELVIETGKSIFERRNKYKQTYDEQMTQTNSVIILASAYYRKIALQSSKQKAGN